MLQWVYPGLSTNDGGDVQQRSGLFLARRGGLFFGPCIVPVVPHKAVAEVSKIGNL